GRAAHHELFREIPLGRQPVTRLELSVGDQLLHLADDFLVDPGRLDGLDLHESPPRHGASIGAGVRDATALLAHPAHHPWSCPPAREVWRRASNPPSPVTTAPNASGAMCSSAWAGGPNRADTAGSSSIISAAT